MRLFQLDLRVVACGNKLISLVSSINSNPLMNMLVILSLNVPKLRHTGNNRKTSIEMWDQNRVRYSGIDEALPIEIGNIME